MTRNRAKVQYLTAWDSGATMTRRVGICGVAPSVMWNVTEREEITPDE
jgi:hypothetical protein